MTDQPEKPPELHLKDADPLDVKFSLAHALLFDGKKHYRQASGFVAQIAAEHIYDQLVRSGFVIMKKPPAGDSAPKDGRGRLPLKD